MDFYKKPLILIFLLFVIIFIPTIVNADYSYTFKGRTYTTPDLNITYDYYVVLAQNVGNAYVSLNVLEANHPINFYYISNYYMYGWRTGVTEATAVYFKHYNSIQTNGVWTNDYSGVVPVGQTYYTTFQSDYAIIEASYPITLYTNNQGTAGDIIYSPPDNYEHYPYFMNTSEDIAVGGQDLIIMPR